MKNKMEKQNKEVKTGAAEFWRAFFKIPALTEFDTCFRAIAFGAAYAAGMATDHPGIAFLFLGLLAFNVGFNILMLFAYVNRESLPETLRKDLESNDLRGGINETFGKTIILFLMAVHALLHAYLF